jgi:methylthioxylose transferase
MTAWVVAGAIATVLTVRLLATHSLVVGSPAGRWVYPYFNSFSMELLLPCLVALALALGMLFVSIQMFERHERSMLAGWLCVGLLAQLALRWYAPVTLGAMVVSDRANSFYGPTLRYDAWDFLSRYADIVDTLPQHARANMPGKVIFFYLLGLFTHAPELMGIMVQAVSNLGAWLLYLVVRDVLQDRRAALYALVLYLFVPGKLFFFPILNTVTPVPILLCFLLFVRFLSTQRWPWALGLGFALYLLAFFEPLPLVMAILFAAFLAAALFNGTLSVRSAAILVGLAAVGFVAIHTAIWMVFRYNLFVNFAYVLDDARGFNRRASRPYDIWVSQNLFDFVLAVGTCAACLVPAALVEVWHGAGRALNRLTRPPALWALGSLAVLTVLDLAGLNRGEVIRLWIFLACFLQALPAYVCARTPAVWPFAVVLGCTLLEAAVAIGTVTFVLP